MIDHFSQENALFKAAGDELFDIHRVLHHQLSSVFFLEEWKDFFAEIHNK